MSAIELTLVADTSDGLARGYPDSVSLGGEIVMESWMPAESEVEARTLRAASDVDGPAIHGRVRSLVYETLLLLVPNTEMERIEQASRLLNAVNADAASGWLHAQRIGGSVVWRSPLRGGSMQLQGDSLRFQDKDYYRVTIIREPYFEDAAAAATSLGSAADLRSRTPIVLTAPDPGTLAAPIELTIVSSGSITGTVRIHLFHDREAPSSWTPGYVMSASASGTDSNGHNQIRFGVSPAPSGKNLGRRSMYEPVLGPSTSANAGAVRTNRDADGLTVGYGASASALVGESEVGILGRLRGKASVFTGLGMAMVDEDTDYYVATAYANTIDGTDWRLVNAPAGGYLAADLVVAGAGSEALEVGLYLAPSERCVILPLIETLGGSGAEYNGTALSLQAAIRPRVSEII